MYKKIKHAIILPLKENFSINNAGAVSIWVSSYLDNTKLRNNIYIFSTKTRGPYLNNYNLNLIPQLKNKILSNLNYIKKISEILKKKNIYSAEVHNRPEYAKYLIKKKICKVNLIFHNDPSSLRDSNTPQKKEFLLKNCNKILFVSNYLKKSFFKDLKIEHKNNIEVIPNSVNKLKKFPKKENLIIFCGKLNKSKGYDIFGQSIIKILNKFKDWKAVAIGNEPREKYFFSHPRLRILDWMSHEKVLKFFAKSSISIVNPIWQEPFGRTAMESASRGCAVITSISGGLQETFKNNLILKKNNTNYLTNLLIKLIENKKKLKKIQLENFKNVLHDVKKVSNNLDNTIPKIHYDNENKKNLKILHISTFGERQDHRIFNISISTKISKGLIRNNHDVINFDYRDFKRKFFLDNDLDNKTIKVIDNYRPELIILGHNNCLSRDTLVYIKKKNIKIIIWYEDAVAVGGPDYKESIDLIEKNHDLIDKYFITTHPSKIKTKIKKRKLHFMPVPVDLNIENGHFYKNKKTKDLFFALSHGVNYGKLKSGVSDSRHLFINELIKKSKNQINFNILGLYDEQPKWNYDYNLELMNSKIALNLSRGKPAKYYSSNRIANLMGNGCLTAIDSRVGYGDFFNDNEVLFYKSIPDLLNKINKIKNNLSLIKKIAQRGRKKYHQIFSNKIVSQFLIDKTFGLKDRYNYKWK